MSALADHLSTPPAPSPSALQGDINSAAPPMTPGGPSAFGAGGPSPGSGGQPQQMPAPTRAQTIAALRHFAALAKQLEAALRDPDLGKADLKNKIIDGVTELVQERMMPPTEAVQILATFPSRPFEQKQWIAQHYQNVIQAREAVLTHHAMAFAGQGPQAPPSVDSHMDDIAGMMRAHYGAGRA
jgi:hypothetical protein